MLRLALESRLMFDAAMAADAAGVVEMQAAVEPEGAAAGQSDASPEPAEVAASAEVPAPQLPRGHSPTEWFFVDRTLPQLSELLANVSPGAEVVLLDPSRDGLAQINETLADRSDVQTIHLVTHGDQGAIMLGSTRLDLASASETHAAALSILGGHLAAGADILIYGCEAAATSDAAAGMDRLAAMLDVDLAASRNATGSAAIGGDWMLDQQSGDIESVALDGGGWLHLLGTLSVGISLDVNTPVSVREDSTLAFTGSNLLQLTLTNMAATTTSVEISVQHGSVSFAPLAAVSLSGGDGSKDTAVTLAGSATAINQVLSTLVYNADPDYNGSDTLRVVVRQALLGITSVATPINLGIDIIPSADIVADSAGTLRDQPITIALMANDHFERAAASVNSVTQPLHGSVTLSGNMATYTPNAGYSGSDSFSYTVVSGSTTETASVALTVTLPNSPPVVIVPAGAIGNEDNVLVFSSANGNALMLADADGDAIAAVLSVTHGTLSLASTTGLSFSTGDGIADSALAFSGSAAAINQALEGLRFSPAGDYNGSATLSMNVSDGQASRLASVPILLAAASDGVDDHVSTEVLTPVTIYPLGNDSFAGNASIAAASAPSHGTVVLGLGGAVIYTPDAGYRGNDSFTVSVSAGGVTETQSVFVTVGINQPPVLTGSLGAIDTHDKAVISVSAAAGFSDSDLGDTLRYSAVGLPDGLSINAATGIITGQLGSQASQSHGGLYAVHVSATDSGGLTATATLTVTVDNPAPVVSAGIAIVNEDGNLRIEALLNAADPDGDALGITAAAALHGTVTIAPDGALSYTPHANFHGLDSITYTVTDADGGSAAGTIAVTVGAVADLPTLQLPTIPVFLEDTPLVFASLLGTRIEIGDVDGRVLEIELSVPGGLLTLDQHAGVNISQGDGVDDSLIRMSGTAADLQAALDQLQLLPGADYHGPLTLTVSLGELGYALNLSAALPLEIAAVADVVDDSVATAAGQAVSFNVLSNDTFEHAGRLVSSFQTPLHGTLTLDAQGQAVYTPTSGFSGNDSFSYTVTSNGTTETAIVSITVAPSLNQAPDASPVADMQRADGAVVLLDLSAAFSDPDGDALVFSASGLPAGLAINTATGVIAGTLDAGASSAVAGGVYTITVSAADGRGGAVSQAFTLTVSNIGPDAGADTFGGAEDGVITGNVLANDGDLDGDALRVDTTPLTQPAHGSVVLDADGSFSYTPDPNYHGPDSFSYRVVDADGGAATATVSLTVGAVNDAPAGAPIADRAASAGSAAAFDAASAFSDADGDALRYAATGLPPGLTLDPASGRIEGTPTTPGNYSVTVTASDAGGAATSQTFDWTVTAASIDMPPGTARASSERAPDDSPTRARESDPYTTRDIDTVLLQAINSVDSLGGGIDLSSDRPLLAAIGAVQSLGRQTTIEADERPVSSVVSGFDASFWTALRTDWLSDGQPDGAADGVDATLDSGGFDSGVDTPVAERLPLPDPQPAQAMLAPAQSVQQQLLEVLQSRGREIDALRNALSET